MTPVFEGEEVEARPLQQHASVQLFTLEPLSKRVSDAHPTNGKDGGRGGTLETKIAEVVVMEIAMVMWRAGWRWGRATEFFIPYFKAAGLWDYSMNHDSSHSTIAMRAPASSEVAKSIETQQQRRQHRSCPSYSRQLKNRLRCDPAKLHVVDVLVVDDTIVSVCVVYCVCSVCVCAESLFCFDYR